MLSQTEKKIKVQQTLKSVIFGYHLKFVDSVSVQQVYPYYKHTFRAPQGLLACKHMHQGW